MSDIYYRAPSETLQHSCDQEEIRKLKATIAKLKTQVPTINKFYTCHAMCTNKDGEECVRNLGMSRGMTDNGQPGWSAYAPIHYTTVEEARAVLLSPGVYSVYDGNYKNGKVWLKETLEVITKVSITQDLEP